MRIRRGELKLVIIHICLVLRNTNENSKRCESREFTEKSKKDGQSETHFGVQDLVYLQ